MSEQVKLGKAPEPGAGRDAVHVAIVPVVATVRMRPGLRVGLNEAGDAEICESRRCIGIVDPFLERDVEEGEWFYLCLDPDSVTGLRHVYHHPALPEETPVASREETPVTSRGATPAEKSESEKWLRHYAEVMNRSDDPEEAFERLLDGLRNRELFAYGSSLHHFGDVHDADELRFHAERYLGIRINWGDFSFSCSC